MRGLHDLFIRAPVRALMRYYAETGHPTLLTRDGKLFGVCDGQDILRGLNETTGG